MIDIVAGDWRSHVVKGIAALAFGVAALLWPGITLLVLVLLFGAYALVDGAITLGAAITDDPEARGHRGWLILRGTLGVLAAVVTFAWPGITALALLLVIAAWAIAIGVVEIVAAVRLREELRHEWALVLLGLLSIAAGIALVASPAAGALAITWLIGWFALVRGVLHVGHAWDRHRAEAADHIAHPPMHGAPA
ncbi:MAG: hypothetical protein JWN46_1097 [Acidimicrobiales bacterium]|nr:hypothetical protein [Acidimicrobiales bacterium]